MSECWLAFLHLLPPLALCVIIFWSYYVYVVIICVNIITNVLEKVLYLFFYHIVFVMMMLSFFNTAFCKNEEVPPRFKLEEVHDQLLASSSSQRHMNKVLEKFCRKRGIVVYTVNTDGTIRICKICRHVKPDRAHHCSTCRTCILKMDHHCPWMNNCVGFSNHKQFVLFLLYGSIFCVFTFATSLHHVLQFFHGNIAPNYGYHIVGIIICSPCFGILGMALLCYHITLITKNKTTLEDMREVEFVDPNFTFDLGIKENFYEVFGEECWLWLLPCETTTGNGYAFPVQLIDSFNS